MKNNYLNITNEEKGHITLCHHNFSNPCIEYNKISNQIYFNPVLNKLSDYIEIGGIKWSAKYIGSESPYTLNVMFFQWGEINGHFEHSTSLNYNYSWVNTPFNDWNTDPNEESWATYSGQILSNYTLISKYDPAIQLINNTPLDGYHWRTPNFDELTTLKDYKLSLTNTIVSDSNGNNIKIEDKIGVGNFNGIKGMCFGKTTTSTDNILFLPFVGGCENDTRSNFNHAATIMSTTMSHFYWDSKYLYIDSSGDVITTYGGRRNNGFVILPILVKD